VTVELFGMARAIVGAPSVEVSLERPMTARRLIASLASAYPALVGTVIEASREALIAPNLLLLDGKLPVRGDTAIGEGDRPCVLFLASGG